MKVTARVTGSTVDELRRNAATAAAEIADGAEHTVKVGDAYGETWDPQTGRDTGRILHLSASIEVTVTDRATPA